MLKTVKPQDPLALGRLLEFLSPTVPWNRSLWGIGLVLSMNELTEAISVQQAGTLSDASIRRVCSSLQLKMGKDPALTERETALLRQQIAQPPKLGGPSFHTLTQMAEALSADYLRRWADVMSQQGASVELFARSVASHVLDCGFSPQYVRQRLKALVSSEGAVTIAEIYEELHGLTTSMQPRSFNVLVAFQNAA